MSSEWGFVWPEAFLLMGVGLAVMYLVTKHANHLRAEAGSLLEEIPTSYLETKWVYALIVLFGCALSRPYFGRTVVGSGGEGKDIVLVLDVSASMWANDESPSRFAVMQREVSSLLEISASSGEVDRFGIVVFAGASAPLCPLTVDRAVIVRYLQALSPDVISTPGSGLPGALTSALDMIERGGSRGAGIVIVSDGESSDVDVKEVAVRSNELGVTISALGVGSLEGGTIPDGRGGFLRDNAGNQVVTHYSPDLLSRIANETSGVLERSSPGKRDALSIYHSLHKADRNSEHQAKISVPNELTPWFAYFTLLIFCIGVIRVPSLLLPCLVWSCIAFSSSRVFADDLQDGRRLFDEGKFDEALEIFRSRLSDNPQSSADLHAAGSSAYRLSQFDEAADYYEKGAEYAEHPKEKFEELYNAGNARLRGGDPQKAIENYDKALAIKHDDPDAMHNRELALKVKEQKEKEQKEKENKKQDQPQSTPTPADNEEPKDGSPPTPSPSQGSNEGNDSGQERETATPTSAPSPKPTSEEPQATTSAEEAGRPTPTVAESQNDQGARAWLESLPDAPLLMRRERSNGSIQGGQRW